MNLNTNAHVTVAMTYFSQTKDYLGINAPTYVKYKLDYQKRNRCLAVYVFAAVSVPISIVHRLNFLEGIFCLHMIYHQSFVILAAGNTPKHVLMSKLSV